MTDVFESMTASELVNKVKMESAFRTETSRKTSVRPRDILIKFADWNSKRLMMSNFPKFGNLIVEGREVHASPDLAPIHTFKKDEI